MALKDIEKLTYKDIFSLSIVEFEKACVINQNEQQVNTYDIYWIQQGKGTYSIDFNTYNFDDNVLFFLSPKQVFSVLGEKIKIAYKLSFIKDFYCIETHDAVIACNGVLFNNIYKTPFVKPGEKDSKTLGFILENLIHEFKNSETAQYDMLQTYLKQFIIHAVRIKTEKNLIKEEKETRLFKDFGLLVEQNFRQMHSVSGYAERLGLSPKSITKHFQKIGAKSPSEFIKERLVLEAKRMLLFSDSSVKEIAYHLGFNDPAYFTRFFTKATSLSPLSYKKERIF